MRPFTLEIGKFYNPMVIVQMGWTEGPPDEGIERMFFTKDIEFIGCNGGEGTQPTYGIDWNSIKNILKKDNASPKIDDTIRDLISADAYPEKPWAK